ncbi:hypothetical protein [Maritimibacter sp. UBA3975]|uniref:hypothetical protein n=1 Tax=Maritimibacter sp. UBA3975 TaxID=1946833 RepID=UPI0025C4C110|nr:hypothetical protein [Maritimibacter sp. UBA3975]
MTLLHVSISAAAPERVARALAQIMGGRALPFPPFPDSWIAFAAADDGSAVEVYPLTHRVVAGHETIDCEIGAPEEAPTFCHVALASPLPEAEITKIARAEGWQVRTCNRGPFDCVEVWLENRLLIEVLDPGMQADYRANMTAENWAAMFGM